MKIITIKIFMILSCGVYVCQAMEETARSPHIQRSTHSALLSKYDIKIYGVLFGLVDVTGEIIQSEELLELEKKDIKQENLFLSTLVRISQEGQSQINSSDTKLCQISLTKIIEDLSALGFKLNDYVNKGKFDQAYLKKYQDLLGQLTEINHEISDKPEEAQKGKSPRKPLDGKPRLRSYSNT